MTSLFNQLSFRTVLFLSISIQALSVNADTVAPGDTIARHHLQYLSDSGTINVPLTTWPISSEEIAGALEQIRPDLLNPANASSYRFLQSIVNAKPTLKLELHSGTYREALSAFSSTTREENEARASIKLQNSRASGTFSISVVDAPLDGKHIRLDGTQMSAHLGNWDLGAGWVDRWWGPGWQSSLILSHNARPSPGVFIRRVTSQPFSAPILKAIGPWKFEAFANQLESDRFIPHAKLLGARFSFKPIPALEIGLSRTAQWGGEGRPQSLATLGNLILGNDNRGDSGIDADASNEPGNQLGGIDWRYSFSAYEQPFAFYGQLIGEDEAGGLPSREIGMIGFEVPVITEWQHGRFFLEFSDTTMRFLRDGIANSAYQHSIYKSGYRHYGQPIGSSSDNDSRMLTLGGHHALTNGHSLNWRATSATINWDGDPAGNLLGPNRIETYLANFEYQFPISDNTHFQFTGQFMGKPFGEGRHIRDSGIGSSLKFVF
ncbi:MAG: capsule assembly Wzi family protein [Opitutaceae bacterium]|nr:capsule assembly Wzi family protein [Opitutaceae bacterium]